MEKYIDDDNGDQVEILRRASITIRFLEINERVSPQPTTRFDGTMSDKNSLSNRYGSFGMIKNLSLTGSIFIYMNCLHGIIS